MSVTVLRAANAATCGRCPYDRFASAEEPNVKQPLKLRAPTAIKPTDMKARAKLTPKRTAVSLRAAAAC